ncbi:NUDIX domain-containing protein [Lacticaseibacillus kribbianus]|uniref:NUDIX domain-containing protein n=1 Tax=Lacticaseibacillus kribbianus TaxID=2926292 RepID=UPI001CD6719D|nr:NUDIX domain-containing protein [Lacticaseibacillus kribbianus]
MTTDKLDEVWDLYDAALRRWGTQRRGDAMPAGFFHLTVAVWVFDGSGRVLIQRRGHEKLNQPDTWDVAAGGSALRGETGAQAAARELHEELGLTVPLTAADRFATDWYRDWVEQSFAVCIPDLDAATLRLQATEVATVALVPPAVAVARLTRPGHDNWAAVLARAWTKAGR